MASWPDACGAGAPFEAVFSGRRNGVGGRRVLGRHQQCARAASGAVPQHLLHAHTRFHDRGTQLAVSAVYTALNAVDLEPPWEIRVAAAVK